MSGALYWNDFLRLAKQIGFSDPRLVKSAPITINNEDLQNKVGDIEFYSATYRLFKLPGKLEPDCEDYGQAVRYKGTICHNEHFFILDEHHKFVTRKVEKVCSNTYNMLYYTRFKRHFDFFGNTQFHYGKYELHEKTNKQ